MALEQEDKKFINGEFEELKQKVTIVETKLDAHQQAFEKHETRDEQRFSGLTTDMKDYQKENTEQHSQISRQVDAIAKKMMWIIGAGVGIWVVIQMIGMLGLQISFGP